ncbi:MAG: DUF2807 domain-containing protein [Prevotella sp.]|nr:DUF2807 domain-containing protein [Prevotella sp.]
MKKTTILTLASVCLLLVMGMSSCMDVNVGGFGNKTIKPSKNIVAKTVKPGDFQQLNVSAVAKVKFIQADSGQCSVKLTGPDNYVELYKIENRDGTLYIDFVKPKTNLTRNKVTIEIVGHTLTAIDNSGVANVEVPNLKESRLSVDNSGVGNITIGNLEGQSVNIECSGVGNITINGTAEAVELTCSGVGNINADGLKAHSVKAEVSGVGGIKCHADEAISGVVSGVGSLKYSGDPKSKDLHRDGIGKISQQ